MAAPDSLNWINQAVTEVASVLRNDSDFMSSSALNGATGVVMRVDEHDIDQSLIGRTGWIACACRYDSHTRAEDDDAAGQQDYLIDVSIRIMAALPLGHRTADRVSVIRAVQRAASVISHVVYNETKTTGGRFGGYSDLAFPIDGNIMDMQDDKSYYIVLDTGIRLHVTLYD